MNEMIERAAKALATIHFMRKQHIGHCTQKERVDYLVNKYWKNFIDDAKAAIQAIREPTDIMMIAMEDKAPSLSCFLPKEQSPSYLAWQAAIDEILK